MLEPDLSTLALLAREAVRREIAMALVADLRLLERWEVYGNPCLVGAAAYHLVVAPDIDLDIAYLGAPRIEDGFDVLKALARHPRVKAVRFANRIDDVDQGYYWQVRCLALDGVEWKIDMWSMAHDHPGPIARDLVEPMCRVLTDETRAAILSIKEALQKNPPPCPSIFVYQAVLRDGIGSLEDFMDWRAQHPADGLTSWRP
jgi:hypothetical protein